MNLGCSASRSVRTFLVVVCGALVGCGGAKAPWEKVVPASGVVSIDGKPLSGAQITLIPEDNKFPSSVRPRGTSKDDGTFAISTYKAGDGAPAGSYKALVLHYPIVGSKESPNAGPNDLPKKYSKVETTDLVLKVDSPASTALELKLERK